MEKQKSHDRIQSEVFIYTWNTYPQSRCLMWHTPNEFKMDTSTLEDLKISLSAKTYNEILFKVKKRFGIQMSRRKAIGVVKGVTDLVLYWKGVLHVFDVKIGRDRLSDEQKRFMGEVVKNGGKAYEINTAEEGFRIVDEIFTT